MCPKAKFLIKTKDWTQTYGEHIGGRVLITRVSSEQRRIQQDLDVVGGCFVSLLRRVGCLLCLRMLRRKTFFYFITPSDWHLDSLHTWMSMCKPFANYSTKHASPTHSSTVVVYSETFVLWYCSFFFPPSIYSEDWAPSAHQSHHNLPVSLTICLSHTPSVSLSLSLAHTPVHKPCTN